MYAARNKGEQPFHPNEQLVYMERVPRSIITGIVGNPLASQFLPPNKQYLASVDWLAEHTFFSTFRKDNHDIEVPNPQHEVDMVTSAPENWHRAIALWTGRFPYRNIVGGTVMCKGGSISGNSFKEVDEIQKMQSIPWGFFGDKDAAKEIEINNELLTYGARVGFPLGYVVLDYSQLKKWLEGRLGDSPARKKVLYNLDQITLNKDNPAVLFRITGSLERLSNIYNKHPTPERLRSEVARSAGLHLKEYEHAPDDFTQYLPDKSRTGELIGTLSTLQNTGTMNIRGLDLYTDFISGIFLRNAQALVRIYKRSKLKDKYCNMGAIMSNAKDICLAMITQDFEQMAPYPPGTSVPAFRENALRYLIDIKPVLNKYFKSYFIPHIVGSSSREDLPDLVKAKFAETLSAGALDQ